MTPEYGPGSHANQPVVVHCQRIIGHCSCRALLKRITHANINMVRAVSYSRHHYQTRQATEPAKGARGEKEQAGRRSFEARSACSDDYDYVVTSDR